MTEHCPLSHYEESTVLGDFNCRILTPATVLLSHTVFYKWFEQAVPNKFTTYGHEASFWRHHEQVILFSTCLMSSRPRSFHLGAFQAGIVPASTRPASRRRLAAFPLPPQHLSDHLTPMWWVPNERVYCSASTSKRGQNHSQWLASLWLSTADHEYLVTQSLPESPPRRVRV